MNAFEFIKTLRKHEVLHNFLGFLEYGEGEFVPKSVNIDSLSEKLSDEQLAEILTKILTHNDKKNIDPSHLDNIIEIGSLYSQAAEIFHVKLEKFDASIDMGDELHDIFEPLLSEQFEKVILSQ